MEDDNKKDYSISNSAEAMSDEEDGEEENVGEMDEEMDTKETDSFSNSAEGSSDDEEDADEEKVAEIKKLLSESPFSYDLHVQLISLCRKLGDLDQVREARETMSKYFPLTPELWLEWLTDENKLVTTAEGKEKLVKLFQRSVKDYTSVSVWLEYVQFAIGNVGDSWTASGIEMIRQTFEKALTAVGIHVTQGCLIWEAYKELESLYLLYLQNKNAAEDEIKEQKEKIFNIYKRRLSIPLLDMEKTYQEFKELMDAENVDITPVHYSYKKAVQKLKALQQYEENLFKSEAPHYEYYKEYIEYEKKEGDPIRVQNLYERAIVENCLNEELWLNYVKYMDCVVKIPDISLAVYERAVRNCPWCTQLWVKYGRAMERYEQPHKKITDVFETALTMGFTKEDDFKEIWLAYLDYLRRQLSKELDSGSSGDFKDIEDVFDRAISQMNQYFWGTESHYVITKYWIYYTVKLKKELSTARQQWKDLISCNHKTEARVWLDYANFEKVFGDPSHYRRVLLSALSSVSDWPETFVDLLLTYEREEGTLETFEKSEERCESELKIINEKRIKKLQETAHTSKRDERRGSRTSKHQSPNKNFHPENSNSQSPVQMDSEGFKIPPLPPQHEKHPQGARQESPSQIMPESKKRTHDEAELPEPKLPEPKKNKAETRESHGVLVKHDPSKDCRTVFLSNLDYKINEEKIKEFCSPIGEIEEIRLVKDFKGRSKGYCYVVYKSELDAQKALQRDKERLEGRPVFVSPCEDKKSSSSSHNKLKFSTGLEKNKVFVKNIPVSYTEKNLEEMFKEHGALKSVRVVTYRNGHSKGIAYVEYEDEESANNAVQKMDSFTVEDKILSVAISNPPPRRPRNEFRVERHSDSSHRSSSQTGNSTKGETSGSQPASSLPRAGSSFGPRGRGRTQLSLVPRAVARSSMGNKVSNSSLRNGEASEQMDTTNGAVTPLSNSDFSNMMKK